MSILEDNAYDDAEAIIRTVEGLSKGEVHELPGSPERVLVLPSGKSIHSLKKFRDEYRDAPERIEGAAAMTNTESLIEYVKLYKEEGFSALFAQDSREHPSLLAVLDYPAPGKPRFGKHRAHYRFPVSDEWKAWMGIAEKPLKQDEFAEFFEEHCVDLRPPDFDDLSIRAFVEQLEILLAKPAELLELAKGLAVHVHHQIRQNVDLGKGVQGLTFQTDLQDAQGNQLKVPGGFMIAIPVFRGGDAYKIPVRLRMKVSSDKGKVTWSLHPWGADRTFDWAFSEAVSRVSQETGVKLYFGTPAV